MIYCLPLLLPGLSACPSSTSSKIIPCIFREARRCRLSHTYDASFTVTDATTTPFRVPVSRNDGLRPARLQHHRGHKPIPRVGGLEQMRC